MSKSFNNSYIYSKYNYDKDILQFVVNAERIDTKGNEFADIMYELKRTRLSNAIPKILGSTNVVLGVCDKSLPKAFKVFCAKDPKDKNNFKVFIDASDIISYKDGIYKCTHTDWLTAYTLTAMINLLYFKKPTTLLSNSTLLKEGIISYGNMFTMIIDYLYHISSVKDLYNKVKYVCGLYYEISIMGKSFSSFDSISAAASRATNIEPRDMISVNNQIKEEDFINIDTFIKMLDRIFRFKDIKTDVIVGLWMKRYGTGTVYALELFPSFCAMMINTYVGGYIDNQVTIEKTAANLPEFVSELLGIIERESK